LRAGVKMAARGIRKFRKLYDCTSDEIALNGLRFDNSWLSPTTRSEL
jgi:hypothetical protein